VFISGIIVKLRNIRGPDRLSQIGDASEVPSPHIHIRNRMPAAKRAYSDPRNALFRTIQRNERQMNFITPGAGPADQAETGVARKSRFHRETIAAFKICINSSQYFSARRNRRAARV